MNNPSVDFHLKLQEPSFRIPYESIKRNFKNVQKLDEKQFKKLEELEKKLQRAKTKDEQLKVLKQMISSLKNHEKKLSTKVQIEEELISRINARIARLNEFANLKSALDKEKKSINSDKLLNWYRGQTNLLIADFLLKNSKYHSNQGLKLLEHLKFTDLIDHDIILVSNKISNSIINQDLTQVVDWIDENKSYLNRIKSNLEFETRFQEYIELISSMKISQALELFRNYLSKFKTTNLNEIKSASGLLIFAEKSLQQPNNPNFEKYSSLLSKERYQFLSKLFLKIYYKMYGISEDDPLLIYLSIGISSLKTHSCSISQLKPQTFEKSLAMKLDHQESNSCPVCSLEFNEISRALPYAHTVKSYLFDNPVMLPNGNIFDKEKLIAFNGKDPKFIKDPITGEQYTYNDLITMYPT